MHESGLIRNLMKQVESLAKENNAQCVSKVVVRVGALTPYSNESVISHFEEAKTGSVASEASIEVIRDSEILSPTAQDLVIDSIEVEGAPP